MNSVIHYNDIKNQPNRANFITDKINISQDILDFMPITFYETFLPEGEDGVPDVNNRYAKWYFKIFMFGILKDGRKACVVINKVFPYFDVMIDPNDDIESVKINIANIFETNKTNFGKLQKIKYETMYQLEGKHKTALEYNDYRDVLRIEFRSVGNRTRAISALSKHDYLLTDSDSSGNAKNSNYNYVVFRNRKLSQCSWLEIQNHTIYTKQSYINPYSDFINCDIIISIPSVDESLRATQKDVFADERLINNRTLICSWDIETNQLNPEVFGIPKPESKTACMFVICLNFSYLTSGFYPNENNPESKNYLPVKPDNYLCHYGITTEDSTPLDNRVVVKCDNEIMMLKAFAQIMGKMKPDIIMGFNDSNYDWDWVFKRASKYNLLPYFEKYMSGVKIQTYNELDLRVKQSQNPAYTKNYHNPFDYNTWYPSHTIKIGAGIETSGRTLTYPGMICVDMMQHLRKHCNNPEKYGLKSFLSRFKLGNKLDMNYQVMFNIHKTSIAIREMFRPPFNRLPNSVKNRICEKIGIDREWVMLRMSHVLEYCFVDGIRCQDLQLKTNIISDAREVGGFAYVPLKACLFNAGGMKVKNMVAAYAKLRNIHFDFRTVENPEKGKYPGAYVFPPKKGAQVPRMTIAEKIEKAKLRTPDIDMDEMEIKQWLEIADDTEYINHFYQDIERYGIRYENWPDTALSTYPSILQNWLKLEHHYPVEGLDFSSLYPSVSMAMNFSPEMLVPSPAKVARLKRQYPDMKFSKVSFEFNGRTIKGWFVRHTYDVHMDEEERIQCEFGLIPSLFKDLKDLRKTIKKEMLVYAHKKEELESLPPDEFKNAKSEYDKVVSTFNYYNAKQKALKILTNTIYGEMGNSLSRLRVLACSGGITQHGQMSIKFAAHIVRDELGCKIYYGDTDSVYISVAITHFEELDKSYFTGKISKVDFYRQAVEISFREIEVVKNIVNARLAEKIGNHFLTMAYEEVLYPCVMTGKKKYFGVPHEGMFLEFWKKLFIRGLECKKKGSSKLLIDLCNNIMNEFMQYNNYHSLIYIVEKHLNALFQNRDEVPMENFIKTASYKPDKANPTVLAFVRKLIRRGDEIPKPYDRFSYIVVDIYKYTYSVSGKQEVLKIGDRWEYPEKARKMGLKPDFKYYMDGKILGALARYISYYPDFQVQVYDSNDIESLREADKKIIDNCRKYIESIYDRWMPHTRNKGKYIKKIYKQVKNIFMEAVISKLGPQFIFMNMEYDNNFESSADIEIDVKSIVKGKSIYNPNPEEQKISREKRNKVFNNFLKTLNKDSTTEAKARANNIYKSANKLRKELGVGNYNFYKNSIRYYKSSIGKAMRKLSEYEEKHIDKIKEDIPTIIKIMTKRNKVIYNYIKYVERQFGDWKRNDIVNFDVSTFVDMVDWDEVKSNLEQKILAIFNDDMKFLNLFTVRYHDYLKIKTDISMYQFAIKLIQKKVSIQIDGRENARELQADFEKFIN
jgi:DNA polymerase elongation subunit (family B)/uncharacterized protein YaaR (DUF327 family)